MWDEELKLNIDTSNNVNKISVKIKDWNLIKKSVPLGALNLEFDNTGKLVNNTVNLTLYKNEKVFKEFELTGTQNVAKIMLSFEAVNWGFG